MPDHSLSTAEIAARLGVSVQAYRRMSRLPVAQQSLLWQRAYTAILQDLPPIRERNAPWADFAEALNMSLPNLFRAAREQPHLLALARATITATPLPPAPQPNRQRGWHWMSSDDGATYHLVNARENDWQRERLPEQRKRKHKRKPRLYHGAY